MTWQDDVQAVMKQAAYRGQIPRTWNYRWEHVQAVVRCAERLAHLTGGDMDVVIAAAWLHDIRREFRSSHPKEGAAFAREFLPTTDFPPEKIERVAMAIELHSGLVRDEPLDDLDAQILWDADKLTKIGATAIIHWMGGGVSEGYLTNTRDVIHRFKKADFRSKTVLSMHTEPAKRAARKRFKAFDKFVSKLDKEWRAEDIKMPPLPDMPDVTVTDDEKSSSESPESSESDKS